MLPLLKQMKKLEFYRLISWCLAQPLAMFQLYPVVNKFYVNLDIETIRNKTYLSITQTVYTYKVQ